MSRDTCSLLILAAAGLTAAMFGCGGGEESSGGKTPSATTTKTAPAAKPAAAQPAAAGADAQAVREANEIFALRCVACHGQQGAGDGPGSAALTPKPRNFQDPAWQSSVSDEHLSAIVLMGGVAVGMSPTMPGNPDLQAKPQVVQALVAHIRSLARP